MIQDMYMVIFNYIILSKIYKPYFIFIFELMTKTTIFIFYFFISKFTLKYKQHYNCLYTFLKFVCT